MSDDINKWRPNNGNGLSFKWLANGLIAMFSMAIVAFLTYITATLNSLDQRINALTAPAAIAADRLSQLQETVKDVAAKLEQENKELEQTQEQLIDISNQASTNTDWIQAHIHADRAIGTIEGRVPVRTHKRP